MRELSLSIEVLPVQLNPEKKKFVFIANDYYHLQSLKASSAAGTLIDCNQSIIIDKPDKSTCQQFSFSRSCVISFTDSKGKLIQIGTEDIPAKVMIVPELNSAHLEISCKMLKSPLL